MPVAAHHARTAHVHAPDFAARDARTGVVADLQLDAVLRPPDRAEQHLGIVAGLGAGDRRRLGHRVAHDQRAAELAGDALDELGRCGRGGRRHTSRSRLTSVSASSGCSSSFAHCVGAPPADRDPLGADQPHHVGRRTTAWGRCTSVVAHASCSHSLAM